MIAAANPTVLAVSWPWWLLAGGLAVAVIAWLAAHRLTRGDMSAAAKRLGLIAGARRIVLIAVRIALAPVAVWLAIRLLAEALVLTTTWPLWGIALAAGLLAEAIVALYALDRRIVPRRPGRILIVLRLALLALLVALLLQPVWTSTSTTRHKRALAILIDESPSMLISDEQLPPHQKLRLAELFSVPGAHRPYRLEASADRLRAVQRRLAGESTWLGVLASSAGKTAPERLADRRKDLHELLNDSTDAVAGEIETLTACADGVAGLDRALSESLTHAKAALNRQVRARLLDCAAWTHAEQVDALADNFDRLRDAVDRATIELDKTAALLDEAGESLDTVLYQALDVAERRAVDAVASLSRRDLAVATLLHRPAKPDKPDQTAPSLLERLGEQYVLSVFTFADSLIEADPADWTNPIPAALVRAAEGAPPAPSDQPGAAEPTGRTDLATALGEVLSRMGGQDLAGIVLLSDGRDNGPDKAETAAAQLGDRGAALCSIIMGGRRPPTDAAIISVDAPESVYLADRMFIDAELKLDGLDGKEVKVTLRDGDRTVDTKTIRVAGDAFRTRLQLADEPKTVGLHAYSIDVAPTDESVREVFADNNAYSLAVSVVDDKTRILLIDSRPRWEFRYLKNLFSGRDKAVRLQYVLLRPDAIAGQSPRARIPASVTRPVGQDEATDLPANEQEWMKFDVIIIGDVPAGRLTEQQARWLKRFVAERGGTIVFIAGPQAMPADHAGGALADLIPLKLTAPTPSPAPGGSNGFRIALTAAGREHVVLRQHVEPDLSARVWGALPMVYWRSPFGRASPASTVLAYALPPDPPAWLTDGPAAGPDPDLVRRRQEYRRSRALVTIAPHGLGRVLMLGFDRTWRLRYRKGDTLHHKFWGQVVRWATAGELPAGTQLVKLGADRTRYPPRSRPKVRAQLVREDFSPVVTDQVAVKVYSGDRLIARRPMRYLADSSGFYTATLDELPAGTYRLVLDAPAAAELLARDGVQEVAIEIAIDPAATAEQIELSANADLLGRLANLSYNGAVVRPHRAAGLLDVLPTGSVVRQHPFELSLKERWPPWMLLGLFCAIACAEWILRKRVGLA